MNYMRQGTMIADMIEATGGDAFATTAQNPDVHHDKLLDNVAVQAFNAGDGGFVADMIMPSVGVGKQSDRYAIFTPADFLRVSDGARAPGAKARRVTYTISSDSYYADNYALAHERPLEDIVNSDNVFRLRSNDTKRIVTDLRRGQEDRVATLLTTAANLGSGTTLSGTNLWSDYNNSDPIGDVNTGHAFIENNTGYHANTMLIDKDTHAILARHPVLLDMFKYTAGGLVSTDNLRAVFRVDRVLIASAIKENALPGGTSSVTNIWGNHCLLAYTEPAASAETATLGLRFNWQTGIFPQGFGVLRSQYNGAGSPHVEVVEAGHYQAEKVIAPNLGYLIKTTI